MNIAEMSMKELVALYNRHAEKPVKRFADRKAAERRVREVLPAEEPAPEPAPEKRKSRGRGNPRGSKYGLPRVRKIASIAAPGATRRESVAKSWKIEPVARARVARHAVIVDGETYFHSLAQAFATLGLPMSAMPRARRVMITNGVLTFSGYSFERTDPIAEE